MVLNADLVPGCSVIGAKPKRAFRIDISLLRSLRAALPKSISTRRPAAGCLQPTMPAASLSPTEIVHFRHCLHPPNGGRTDVDRGTLDPAALEPSHIWNGHLARRRTTAISGDPDRAGTIPGVGRTSSAPRRLVRTPGQATWCHQGARGIRQELIGGRLGRETRAKRQLRWVADHRFRRRRGHTVSILRISGPTPCLPRRWRRGDWADP